MRRELDVSRGSHTWGRETPECPERSESLLPVRKPIPKGGLFSELFRGMFPWGEEGLTGKGRKQLIRSADTSFDKQLDTPQGASLMVVGPRSSAKAHVHPLQSVLDELADGRQYWIDPEDLETLFWQVVAEAKEVRREDAVSDVCYCVAGGKLFCVMCRLETPTLT
jgi:hypothetical protein